MSALVLCLSHVGERKTYKVCELFLLLHDCQCSTECTLHGSQLRQAAKRVLLSTAHHKTSAKICTALRKHTGLKQPSRAERKLVLFSLSLSLSLFHTHTGDPHCFLCSVLLHSHPPALCVDCHCRQGCI